MNSWENPFRIAVLSNILFEPHFPILSKQYLGKNSVIFPIPFEEYAEKEYQTKLAGVNFTVVWLSLEALSHDVMYTPKQQTWDSILAVCRKLYQYLEGVSTAKILWFLFEDYTVTPPPSLGHGYHGFVDRLNAALQDTLGNLVTFIDLKGLIAEVGIAAACDRKGKYRWNAPYSKVLIDSAVKEIQRHLLTEQGITKKCLVLDCDNVLWGGILSEDGAENLKLSGNGLGRLYQDFQRFVFSLYRQGVILAVCSKNDLSDVLAVFRKHREMVLKEEHISCFQVNWENKPGNLQRIAENLNIGLDSMVFVDDSVIEIEAVKVLLPEVAAIRFVRDMNYGAFDCFRLKDGANPADIEKRNETYRTNALREELRAAYADAADYIAALDVKIDIHEARPIEYGRISELTQRTNKCTNGVRYTMAQIKERAASSAVRLYAVSVTDRFSDLGLVGTFEVQGDTLTLFSLSCRALGRDVEQKMLTYIGEKYQIHRADFHSTGKNAAIRVLLTEKYAGITF